MAAQLTDVQYRKHVGMVYRVCLRMLGSHAEAEDAAHDAFVRFLRSGFRGDSRMSTFLYAIATRICIDRFRKASRDDAFMRTWSQLQEEKVVAGDARAQNLLLIARVLENHDQREDAAMAACYYVHGMTEAEIGQAFDMKRRTVSFRLSRFVGAARKKMGSKHE